MAASKNTPKDIQVMASILRDVGVSDFEPKVLNQMLEFSYRYVTTVLEDAQKISAHAKKKTIDKSDVVLALQIHLDKHFVLPPSRESLLEYAEGKNSIPLPLIKSTAGPRLPPDRYSLTAVNYRLRSNKKKPIIPNSRVNLPFFPQSSSANKLSTIAALTNKNNPLLANVLKPAAAAALASSKQNIASTSTLTNIKAAQTPIIKFSDGNRATSTSSSSIVNPLLPGPAHMPAIIKTETAIPSDNGIKRKREDDDDVNFDA